MTIRVLIDMNLPPCWVDFFHESGIVSQHWSVIGSPGAKDAEIMAWALANDYSVLTHDLDFSTLLALSHATGPSVIQVRTENVMPDHLGATVLAALTQHELALESGALLVVDDSRKRVRILPL
jgi:predicted nuclease of predicted toxin-antitoxin system